MNEIRLSQLLHFGRVGHNLNKEKAPPPPDSYFFKRVDGKLVYVIPGGQVPAGELEQRIAGNLQDLVAQVQEKLSKTDEA